MTGVLVIVPAAGSGTRFGSDLPKQFHPLGGKPILQHVLERFLLDDTATRIVVPVAEGLLSTVRQSGTDRVQFVAGGATRQESVMRGFETLADEDVVAVHDAVRPFFAIETFHAVVAAAREHGAALPAVPLTDTIHEMVGDRIGKTIDRTSLVAAQTPQAFRADILRDALVRAQVEGVVGTDEAGLAAHFGHKVSVVAGDPMNMKITRAADLAIADTLWRQWGTANA